MKNLHDIPIKNPQHLDHLTSDRIRGEFLPGD